MGFVVPSIEKGSQTCLLSQKVLNSVSVHKKMNPASRAKNSSEDMAALALECVSNLGSWLS